MFIEFVIQNQFFSYSLEEFAQILDIPCEGACVFIDKWSLAELAYGLPTDGPYQTNPPSPGDIISSIQIDREGHVYHIRHEEEIDVHEYQILTREIVPTLKPLEEIIRENILCLGDRKTKKDRGTRRGRHPTSSSSAFDQPSSSYLNDDDDDGNGEGTSRTSTSSPICYVNSLTNEVPQVFQNPSNIEPHLEPFYTRQTEIINHQVQIRDEHRGGLRSIRKVDCSLLDPLNKPSFSFFLPYSSSSNNSTVNSTKASSSNPSKKINLTIVHPRQLFVNISSDEDVTTTPSLTTTSSSPTPPNAPSKTTSINQTSSNQEKTSSSFQSKLQISPPSSNEPTSPRILNPLLNNISDVPPRPLNPQPLQSTPSLDITLSLSPITHLDHIHDTLSPPSLPQPQPPIMGHPLYYNYHNYHGSNCICCFHNRTLCLTLRDKMNIMFPYLEYLLTTAITSHFPPPP
ncbi:hypothetical protein Tco_0774848 [Tanacetum coccineum]|uniref:Uncharacterized protein n=1 Tax=Tanacetum coccineum TaxID=301880 RepID=A0ABQ4ZSV7_9ASTR